MKRDERLAKLWGDWQREYSSVNVRTSPRQFVDYCEIRGDYISIQEAAHECKRQILLDKISDAENIYDLKDVLRSMLGEYV